eukprot:s1579_g20.t1
MAVFDIQARIRARLESESAPPVPALPTSSSVPSRAGRAEPSPESSPRATIEKDKDEDSETPRPKVKAVPKGTSGKGRGRGRGRRSRGSKSKPDKSPEEAKESKENETDEANNDKNDITEPKENDLAEPEEDDLAEPREDKDSVETKPGAEEEAEPGFDEGGSDAPDEDVVKDTCKKPATKFKEVKAPKRRALKRPAAALSAPAGPPPTPEALETPAPKPSTKQRKGETTRETRELKSGWKAGSRPAGKRAATWSL